MGGIFKKHTPLKNIGITTSIYHQYISPPYTKNGSLYVRALGHMYDCVLMMYYAREIQLCCLLKANFSTTEINMLTRQSLQTIYQRKTQIIQTIYQRNPQIRQKLSIPEADDILHHLS